MEHERKTKPELWERIEKLEQEKMWIERFLLEKGLLDEALQYLDDRFSEYEDADLPF